MRFLDLDPTVCARNDIQSAHARGIYGKGIFYVTFRAQKYGKYRIFFTIFASWTI